MLTILYITKHATTKGGVLFFAPQKAKSHPKFNTGGLVYL